MYIDFSSDFLKKGPFFGTVKRFFMNQEQILQELLSLLEEKGVRICREDMGGRGGGLCVVGGEKLFFLDNNAGCTENIHQCGMAVNDEIDIEEVYITPEVREYLEKLRKK